MGLPDTENKKCRSVFFVSDEDLSDEEARNKLDYFNKKIEELELNYFMRFLKKFKNFVRKFCVLRCD